MQLATSLKKLIVKYLQFLMLFFCSCLLSNFNIFKSCFRFVTAQDVNPFDPLLLQVFCLTWTHFYTPDGLDGLRARDTALQNDTGSHYYFFLLFTNCFPRLNAF